MFRTAALVAATTLLASCTQVTPITDSPDGGRVATPVIALPADAQPATEAVRIGENDAYWQQLSTAQNIAVESAAGRWGSC